MNNNNIIMISKIYIQIIIRERIIHNRHTHTQDFTERDVVAAVVAVVVDTWA